MSKARISQTGFVVFLDPAGVDPPTPPDPNSYLVTTEDCPDISSEIDVRLYDSTGKRKQFNTQPDTVDFEYLERGGFGQGTISALATWEDIQLVGNEYFDIWLFGEIAYRGYVKLNENTIEDPERVNLTLYGLMEKIDNWKVNRRYSYGCGSDISTLFTDLVNDYIAVSGRLSGISVDSNTIGVTVTNFDAIGKSLAQAMNQLCDLAPGQCIWGFDLTSLDVSQIYLRVKSDTVTYRHVVGDNVEAFVYPRDVSSIVNRIYITGGKVDQPNLLTNGDFEDPRPASEILNNLLLNYSFEDNPNTFWTLNAGATIKDPTIGATAHGSARSGSHWLELDQTGENAVSAFVRFDHTVVHVMSAWVRYEDAVASAGDTIAIVVQGYDVGGSTVALAVAQVLTFDPAGDVYKNVYFDVDFTAYSTVTKVKVTITGSGGSASNDGILVDDVGLWQKCTVGQFGWRMNLDGNATIDEVDWALKSLPTPFRGGYCVKLDAAGIALASDTLTIYTPKAQYVSVEPDERYTFMVRWQNRAAGSGGGVISIGATPIKSDGSQDTLQESAQITADTSVWQLLAFPIQTASDTVALQVFIRTRSNNAIYVDSAMLVKGGDPPMVTDDNDFWSGENYELVIDVDDADLNGLLQTTDCDAEDSITDYDEHEEFITNAFVLDRASAITYATDYFKAHGCPLVQAHLTITGPRSLMKQAGTVKLINMASGPPELFPTRIQYKINGNQGIVMTADLGNDRPEMADLLSEPSKFRPGSV